MGFPPRNNRVWIEHFDQVERHAMPDEGCSGLPDQRSWRFDDIRCADADRASALEGAGTPSELVTALMTALDKALDCNDVRIGRERAPKHRRAVIQFGIGAELFDWLFNARTGYRAHFRAHFECGLAFNQQIIEALRRRLDTRLPDIVLGRELNSTFEDCGEVQISNNFLMTSLTPGLSKIWPSTKRIKPYSGDRYLGIPRGKQKIQLGDGLCWPAFDGDKDFAWLDIKGGFPGRPDPDQWIVQVRRAKTLQAKGVI